MIAFVFYYNNKKKLHFYPICDKILAPLKQRYEYT